VKVRSIIGLVTWLGQSPFNSAQSVVLNIDPAGIDALGDCVISTQRISDECIEASRTPEQAIIIEKLINQFMPDRQRP
jgi:predicted P-loop ATPase/GTPase